MFLCTIQNLKKSEIKESEEKVETFKRDDSSKRFKENILFKNIVIK